MPDDYLWNLQDADLASPQAIEALVHAATGERVSATEKLIRGYANQVYRVTTDDGRKVIVRIAFDDRSFDAEAAAMRQARAAGVPVPEIVAVAPITTVRGPRAAMVMAAASGRPLAELEPSFSADQRAAVYTHVGAAMRVIHSVPLNHFGTVDDVFAAWDDLVDAWVAACQRAAPALRGAGLADDEIAGLLTQVASLRASARPSAVLCHGDLSTEHIFVDDDLRVSAIIDWGQASAAEPALDLAILRMFHPDVELAWLQRGYGPEASFNAAFQRRMTAHTTVVAIHYLDFDSAQGDGESVAAARDVLRQNLTNWAHSCA